jgi:hypothetical protein
MRTPHCYASPQGGSSQRMIEGRMPRPDCSISVWVDNVALVGTYDWHGKTGVLYCCINPKKVVKMTDCGMHYHSPQSLPPVDTLETTTLQHLLAYKVFARGKPMFPQINENHRFDLTPPAEQPASVDSLCAGQ